jgi:hypothetical protein
VDAHGDQQRLLCQGHIVVCRIFGSVNSKVRHHFDAKFHPTKLASTHPKRFVEESNVSSAKKCLQMTGKMKMPERRAWAFIWLSLKHVMTDVTDYSLNLRLFIFAGCPAPGYAFCYIFNPLLHVSSSSKWGILRAVTSN